MGLFGFKKKESKSEFRKEFQTFDISGNGLVLSGEEQELMIHVLEKQGKDVGFDASGVKKLLLDGKTLSANTLVFCKNALGKQLIDEQLNPADSIPGVEPLCFRIQDHLQNSKN